MEPQVYRPGSDQQRRQVPAGVEFVQGDRPIGLDHREHFAVRPKVMIPGNVRMFRHE